MNNNLDKSGLIIHNSDYSHNFNAYRYKNTNGTPQHRYFSADFWEETIPLILSFVRKTGLKPEDKFLDLGSGALRCGLAVIPYLNKENYYAIDINQFLLEDGYNYEIIPNKLDEKFPKKNIIITSDFDATLFNVLFDYVFSFSLWTHLKLSECEKCLKQVSKILKPGGVYFTTCFIVSPDKYYNTNLIKCDINLHTYHNHDPFHHLFDNLSKIGDRYNFKTEYFGQSEMCFRKHDIIKFTRLHCQQT